MIQSYKRLFLLVLLFMVLFGSTFSQVGDTLVPLRYNRALFPDEAELDEPANRSIFITNGGNQYIFRVDTMHLPFVDDFSSDKRKSFNVDLNQPGLTTVVDLDFLVNGIAEDILVAVFDTSYTYTYNANLNQWDSVPNPTLIVTHFLDENNLNLITGRDTVWKHPEGRVVNGVFVPGAVPIDTTYVNTIDTLFDVPDDGKSLWTDRYAYVNSTFGVNPPTIGVATFDGLGLFGEPHAQSLGNPNAYGGADTLTSKPIYLKTKPNGVGTYNNADSIYLSFFYQPQGRGERPDESDSLVLEFFSPTRNAWELIWNAQGESNKPFEQVMIPINDTNYFQDGFRFRFRNRATITGNLDHWHIDYVRLDDARSINDTDLDDVAFVQQPPSLIQNYTQIPWAHYKSVPTQSMQPTVELPVKNNSTTAKLVNFSFQVEEQGANIHTSGLTVVPNFGPQTQLVQPYATDGFEFPTASADSFYAYTVNYVLNTTPDINRQNDTATWYQQFKSSYAYDDGSAELAYHLIGANAQVAYEFSPVVTGDSLRGVYVYFPKIYENVTSRPIRFKVWTSLEPENLLYESNVVLPNYTPGRDLFTRIEFEEAIPIEGTYYIGFQQNNPESVYIGFDANLNNQEKIFYNVGSGWTNTLNTGSLLIRPDFGIGYDPYPVGNEEPVTENELPVMLYPNPAETMVQLSLNGRTGVVNVYSMNGALVHTEKVVQQTTLDVQQWEPGMYLILISTDRSEQIQRKLIVN